MINMKKKTDWDQVAFWILMALGLILLIATFFKNG